ncbi:Uncharacterised protein [Mycobacteroides abscessus subsp. massiliense]|nr:Uncharacterised protein [Mycobacteroides abscessus subsp. massiliense]
MPAESNVPWALLIKRPNPLLAPAYSPTTAPIRANPNAVCRLDRIQLVALGSTIEVRMRVGLAPRIRALLITFPSTSRAPVNALKNTAKNTRTTTVATLELSPRPNQMMNSDANTMRGTALSALMNGANTSDQ